VSDDLLRELLDKPVGPETPARKTNPERDFTRQVEVTGDVAAVTVRGSEDETTEDVAAAQLWAQGLDPAEWAVTGYRSSEWTMANGETGVSRKFSFVRAGHQERERPDLDHLFDRISRERSRPARPEGDHGFLVLLGDMQFGKVDGDGVEGTLRRTIGCLDQAADRLLEYSERFPIGHVHVGWLGDHVEGFVSQGGANVWRTPLTLNEQIRLTRRVMLYALELFAPLAERVSMAAVPGNHGESVRFAGKGVTRYDDSHDTESLIAVADAAKLNPDAFGHVEFYVPETDELTVVLDVAGTVVAHAHGHQWRPGKHFEWWKGQAFNKQSAMHQADLLVAGHLHHEFIDTDGPRTFIQPPSMESESTWWRHAKGTTGAPGLIVAVTKDGETNIKEVVRSE
jgi:predicted phosphodiesterase